MSSESFIGREYPSRFPVVSGLKKVDKSYAYSNRASVMHLWDNENPMNVFEWELGQTLEALNINNDETEIAIATEGFVHFGAG